MLLTASDGHQRARATSLLAPRIHVGQLLPVASDRFRAGQIGGQIAN